MKTSTFSFSFLPLILLFFFPLLNTTIAKNLVPQTCKKCAQRDPNLSYKFCTTSLQAVPKSDHADLRELGAISIKLVRHNVTSTKHFIKHLLKRKKLDRFTKACLEDCLELYSDALPTIKQALKNYRLKRYADANIKLSSVLDAPVTCEDGFKEKKGLVSPLTTKNNEAFQLSAISLSIINMLSSL